MDKNLVTRSLTMEYAPIGGEGDFYQKAAKLAFGGISNVPTKARNVTIQGISGTGFLTISVELMSKQVGTRQSTSHKVLQAQGFAKNTYLYAERVVAFTVVCTDKDEAVRSVRVKSV